MTSTPNRVGLVVLGGCLSIAAVGHAQTPPAQAVQLDDGFTWFSAEDQATGGPTPHNDGWHLASQLRAVGNIAQDSAFKLVLRQGHHTLAQARCVGTRNATEGMYVDDCGTHAADWIGGDVRLSVTGDVQVDVLYVDGQTDAETPLRTYTVNLQSAARVREGNFTPDAPRFYVSAPGRMLDTILRMTPPRTKPYLHVSDYQGTSRANVEMILTTSTTDLASSLGSPNNSLRCTVDGAPVAIELDQAAGGGTPNRSYAVGRRRPTSGNELVEEVHDFRRISVVLPITFGAQRRAGAPALEDHPGVWQCDLVQSGQTLRTIRFTVRDGAILPHAEEGATLNFGLGAHLVDTWIPGAELAADQPLDRAALRGGGFYGRAWTTPAGTALAADPTHAPAVAAPSGAAAVTATATATADASAPASALVVDDGYAWYELRNTVEPVSGRPTNVGWTLVAGARVYGTVGAHGAFHFVLKQGSRALGELRCDATALRGASPGVYTEACGSEERDVVHGPMRLSAMGALTVEESFIDGATNHETALRTRHLEVLAATGVRNGNQPDATNYYVSHNDQLLSAVVMPVLKGTIVDAERDTPTPSTRGYLSFEASPTEPGGELFENFSNQWRCRVGGQPVTLPETQAVAVNVRSVTVVHTHSSGEANPVREPVIYTRYMLQMPVSWGSGRDLAPRTLALEQTPGDWECDWRNNGQTLRTFRFVVGADGKFAAHAEESATLTFSPGAHLAEMVIPSAAPADQRVDPAALRAGAFYGRPWATDAGRALAGHAPTIGTAAPPQPRH